MKRTILIYGLAIAAAASLLQWLQYRYAVRVFSTEIFIGAIAVLFTLLGIWVGTRLTRRSEPHDAFEKNERAIAYLGISDREYDVLTCWRRVIPTSRSPSGCLFQPIRSRPTLPIYTQSSTHRGGSRLSRKPARCG